MPRSRNQPWISVWVPFAHRGQRLVGPVGLLADESEVRFPTRHGVGAEVLGRQRVALRPEVEQEACQGPEVVREQVSVLLIECKNAATHGQVLVPTAELYPGAGQGVVTLHDRGVERRHQNRMKEIEEIGRCGPKPLDAAAVQGVDRLKHLRFTRAAGALVEKGGKGKLIAAVFVDVGDAELRLPKEGMVGSLEDLALLGD